MPLVSAILPSYNEAGNLVPLIRALRQHLPPPFEILVVDDNSPDGSARIVREAFAADDRVSAFVRTSDRGLAKSIREGIERSRGDLVLVMDTDFSHDPAAAGTLVDLSRNADMVTASRYCAGGGMEPRWYYHGSRVFNHFIGLTLGTGLADNLFGYFVIHRAVLATLPLDAIFYGYGDYFFRLLWHVRACGGSIVEVPAFCRARREGRSKSSVVSMVVTYTLRLARLRLRQASGRRPRALVRRGPGAGVRS
jgi:dolichol-phosphate mannosyltransferase